MAELKLVKPIEIDGVTKSVIEYDLDNLKGDAIENAVKRMQKDGYVPMVQEFDAVLHAHIFAEAAGIDYTDVRRFSAKDYFKAVSAVRDFFLNDSAASPQESTSGQSLLN